LKDTVKLLAQTAGENNCDVKDSLILKTK